MDVIKTAIEGVVIIEPTVFRDARGYFFESFSQQEFEEKVRKINFVQNIESILWRDERFALSASSIYPEQTSSLCLRSCS